MIKYKPLLFPILVFIIFFSVVTVSVVAMTLIKQGLIVYEKAKSSSLTTYPMKNTATASPLPGQYDKDLGYSLKPNQKGHFFIHQGDPVPYYTDSNGFRNTENHNKHTSAQKEGNMLFFGDSFTYGMLVSYDNSYPAMVASQLNLKTINAGVLGFGLAEILIYAKKIVPQYRPKYIIVQYSPWLVIRSKQEYITDSNYTPAPFFSISGKNISIEKPAYPPLLSAFERVEKYRLSKNSFIDKLSFLTTVGLPIFLNDIYHRSLVETQRLLGISPKKLSNSKDIIRYTYAEFDKIAKENNSQLVIVTLGTALPLHVPYDLFPKDAIIANAWVSQVEALSDRSSWGYIQKYFLWRGSPPQPVDWHPNETAHALIAETIVDILKPKKTKSPYDEQNIEYEKNMMTLDVCHNIEEVLKILPKGANIDDILSQIELPEFITVNQSNCKNDNNR